MLPQNTDTNSHPLFTVGKSFPNKWTIYVYDKYFQHQNVENVGQIVQNDNSKEQQQITWHIIYLS